MIRVCNVYNEDGMQLLFVFIYIVSYVQKCDVSWHIKGVWWLIIIFSDGHSTNFMFHKQMCNTQDVRMFTAPGDLQQI